MKKDITNRLTALRAIMIRKGISAFIVPSTDPHSGEYVPEYWETRKWISGFTGSAGTVVITLDKAGLWTDSRYFIQAIDELSGSGAALHKTRVPGAVGIPECTEYCSIREGKECYSLPVNRLAHKNDKRWPLL